MIPIEIKISLRVEMFKNKISKWESNDYDSNLDKIICIEMDMLTWLMTNPFIASILILVITDPRDSVTCKLGGCCKHLQMW